MKKTNVFPLSNLTLYAKGWYKQNDVWDDLIKILELDNYSPLTKSDVYNIIVGVFDRFDHRDTELKQVLFSISRYQCWKVGYYTNDCEWLKEYTKLPTYDMPTAFIYHVLSTLRFLDNNQWKPITPKFQKFPKNPKISTKKVIEMFNK